MNQPPSGLPPGIKIGPPQYTREDALVFAELCRLNKMSEILFLRNCQVKPRPDTVASAKGAAHCLRQIADLLDPPSLIVAARSIPK